MKKKELVFQIYTKAIDFYKTSDIPQHYLEALTTVESSIHKFGVEPADIIRGTPGVNVDWDRLVYQIVYDLQHGWYVSLQFGEEKDAIGQKALAIELADFLNKEGYSFSKTYLDDDSFNVVKEKYNLV